MTDSVKYTEAHFDAKASRYQAALRSSPYSRNLELLPFLLAINNLIYNEPQKLVVADLLCGGGYLTSSVKGLFRQCYGVDVSAGMLSYYPVSPGVKRIKSRYPDIKVIMQTVYEDNEKIFSALKNGAEGYILKKASIASIIESINEVQNGGAFMTPSVALQVLKFLNKPVEKDERIQSLSPREREVLTFLAEGDSYKMIAERMQISYGTVNNHIKKIYEKLQVHSLGEAVSYALKSKTNL